MNVEYRVRLVSRFVVTRAYDYEGQTGGVEPKGEYENGAVAYEVAYALCKAEHESLGYPPGDERIKYPDAGVRYGKIGASREMVAAELDRLNAALVDHMNKNNSDLHPGFAAAQQALCWAMDPDLAAPPFNTITGAKGPPEPTSAPSFGKIYAGIGPETSPPDSPAV